MKSIRSLSYVGVLSMAFAGLLAGVPAEAASPRAMKIAQASGTEAALKKAIADLQKGTPDYDSMEVVLSTAVKQQIGVVVPRLKQLGALKSVAFQGQQNGADVYDVRFENGATVWMIALSPSGKIAGLLFQ
jgi:hypothetical protein